MTLFRCSEVSARVEPVETPLNQEKHNDLPPTAPVSVPTGATAQKTEERKRDPVFEEPDEPLPEFMTNAMRKKISETCMRERHVAQIRKFLRESKSACDDQHQFNPSEFDMENCMRINLKPDYEAPPPEFRKQGHHMVEIIAAQIKEMEDAGWIFRGKSSTACPLHVGRKPTEPGKPQKWRITCDYRELNKVIRNHDDPLPDVTETIRAV